jgi:hypothetical protein
MTNRNAWDEVFKLMASPTFKWFDKEPTMSRKTVKQLEEEIAQLRARNMSALEAEEYKQEALRLERILEENGIPHPDCLMSQIKRIEKQYRDEIMMLAKQCETQTGRPLNVAFYGTISLSGEELI